MSEITRGVIGMPFKLAMGSDLSRRQFHARAQDLMAECDQVKVENEALLTALKGMTSMYGCCWDLVDGGLLCMQDNVQRFEDAHEAAQKVIAAMAKGEQS